MYCPKCGTISANDNNWCVKCGYNFSGIPIEDRSFAENNDAEAAVKEEPSEVTSCNEVEELCDENEETAEPVGETVKAEEIAAEEKKNSREIKEYFVWSIISALLCNIAFGVAAVIFSGMTNAEKCGGNTEKAKVYSAKTRLFCILALILGAIKYLYIIGMAIFVYAREFLWYLF